MILNRVRGEIQAWHGRRPYPLTGLACVSRFYTDHGVFDVGTGRARRARDLRAVEG